MLIIHKSYCRVRIRNACGLPINEGTAVSNAIVKIPSNVNYWGRKVKIALYILKISKRYHNENIGSSYAMSDRNSLFLGSERFKISESAF
ncbi:unnamed protein product [Blepharisma stoltei]|uniref:Uncharacterized protein n=1 Tax=Blepharisma stoltei TaxID=1481888 RepID=A0AAU9KEB1_9CILI|nr:unnamed protein product [Blepharisma stoltei]